MPTIEEHRAALAKAQAAGDSAAVAEIQQAIDAAPKPYDKKVYQGALTKAWGAKDVPAVVEIADDWMAAADAAGKRSPMQYSENELRDRYNDAVKAGDNEGVILLSVAAKRKNVNLGDNLASFTRSLGRGADKLASAAAALPGAAMDVAQSTGRGVAAIAADPSKIVTELPGAIADNALTMARSIPGAEYVEAGGGQIVNLLEGEGLTSGLVEEARAAQAEQAARNPVSALAGQVAGTGAVANRLMTAPALKLAPQAGAAGNVARTAATGGVTEAAVGLADTGDVVEAANRGLAGAILTPVAGAVIKKGFDIGAPAVRAVTGKALPSGLKKLSQIVKIPVRDLDAARVRLKAVRGGQNPSIAEIVDTATLQRTQPLVKSQAPIAKAAMAARETAEKLRPTNLKRLTTGSGDIASPQAPLNARTRQFTQMMDTHGRRPVTIDDPSYFNRPAVRKELKTLADNADAPEQAILHGFMDAMDAGRAGTLTLRDLEAVRNTISAAIDANPNLMKALDPVRKKLERIGGSQVSEYGAELEKFRRLGDVSEGIEIGRKGVTGSIEDMTESLRSPPKNVNPAARKRGAEIGFRTKVAEDAGDSFGRSEQTARAMESPAFIDRASMTLGPDEAARISQGAALEAKAAQNLRMLDPAPNPSATAPGSPIGAVADLAAAAGPSGVGFKVNAIRAVFRELQDMGMSKKAAEGLAEALFDPAQSQRAVEVLRRIGKYDEIEMMLATELAAGLQAGGE